MPEPKREPEQEVIPIEGDERAADRPQDTDVSPRGETPLSMEMAQLRAEKEELTQTLMRRQADFENFKKRTERDRSEEARRGVERLMTDLIPVLDAFDRALKAHAADPDYEEYAKGVMLIRKQLWDAMSRHGLERIDAAGKMFDPHVHQAVERAESSEYPDGTISDVFQDGYMFNGRVLRPAIVRVVVHPVEN